MVTAKLSVQAHQMKSKLIPTVSYNQAEVAITLQKKNNNPESYCEFQFIYTIVLAHPPLQAFLTPLEVTQTT